MPGIRQFLITLGLLAASPAALRAQLPAARLFTIAPPGGKTGSTFDVTVGGADLDEAAKLQFSQPGITAVQKTVPPGTVETLLKEGPRPVPNLFTVTIAPDAAPGVCDVRVIGKYGISNPRAFHVGTLDEAAEIEPNNTPVQATEARVETTINGAAGGGADVDCFKLALKAGQRVLIESWAYRLDSRLDATLVLLDAAGQEIERSRDAVQRDALLDFTAPADGQFVVKLYDFIYGGSAEHLYRLTISSAPRVDYVLPPAGLPGSKAQVTLYGRNLPGGQPAPGVAIEGKPLESLAVEVEFPGGPAADSLTVPWLAEPRAAGVDGFAHRLPAQLGIAPPLFLGMATAPPVLEAEPNNEPAAAQKVQGPCEVAGQFFPRFDQDWFSLDVKAGEVFWIEVLAHRLGEPVDPFLLIQHVRKNDKGEEQVQEMQAVDDTGGNSGGANFDTSTDDAAFRFAAPADGACRILVRDLTSGSFADPRNVYRLSIRKEKPDFRLIAAPRSPGGNPDPNQNPPTVWCPFLRRGGAETIEVYVLRRDGFGGEVQIALEGLPQGVACPGAVIPPGATAATLVLTAAVDAPEWAGVVRIAGKAKIADAELVRQARCGAMIWPGVENQNGPRSRLSRDIALAVSGGEQSPFHVEAGKGAPLEMCLAGTLKIPVEVARRGEFKGNVALAAMGLPANVAPKNITLDEKTAAGVLELGIQPNAPVGTYTIHFRSTSQVAYSRNPEAAQRAAARKAEIDKIVPELAAAAKTAAEAKAAADKVAADAVQATAKAAEAQTKAALDSKPAADLVKAAADAVKGLADGIKAAADKTSADAEARSRGAAEAQAAAAKLVTDTANAAKPANVNVAFPSNAVTIRITPAPITLSAGNPPGPLKAGVKIEVPVTITRLYGYNDPVQVTVAFPGGVAGLSAPAVTIPAGEAQAKVVIEAAAGATAGQHSVTIQATAKFNNQNLQASQAIPLKVE